MEKTKKTNTLQILINVLIWIFIFALPFLMFWRGEGNEFMRHVRNHSITVVSSAFVFYLNYFLFTDKFLFTKRIGRFLLYNLILILIVGFLMYYLKEFRLFDKGPDMPAPMAPRKYLFYFREVFYLAFVIGLSTMTRVLARWYVMEAERQEEEKRRKEAELLNLRQQINPHFFFNTLNNIYALIAISPEKAQNTVLELSKLMRYVLYDNSNNFVPLYKELDFIRNYIELMRIRQTDKVQIDIAIEDISSTDKSIAPMIFITLIENAFKHGVSSTKDSFIHVDIHQENQHIVCIIRNSYFPKDENDRSGSGIGLENLHRRLDILYPHQHVLKSEVVDNVYVCELKVPLK